MESHSVCVARIQQVKFYLKGEFDGFTQSTGGRRAVESVHEPLLIGGGSLLCHERSYTAVNRTHYKSTFAETLSSLMFETST